MATDKRKLRIEYASTNAISSEYLSNISNGGIFISTREQFVIRESVLVELVLGFCEEPIRLEGEVVQVVRPEMVEAGATPGLAIQFDKPARQIRALFEPILGEIDDDERKTQTGRRSAARSKARVAATLDSSSSGAQTSRTRDISNSGLLISVKGIPLPIGEQVHLNLTNPENGEKMRIPGRVARHVRSSDGGVVVAMGITFVTDAATDPGVKRFLRDLRVAEHKRKLTSITGPIAELGIANILQMFSNAGARGRLLVSNGADEGSIGFAAGELLWAEVGDHCEQQALVKLLAWRKGQFEFHSNLDCAPADPPGPAVPLEAAILDALCTLDEDRHDRAAPSQIAPSAHFDLLSEALVVQQPELSKLQLAIIDLIALDEPVSKLVERLDDPEIEIYLGIDDLLERGILRIR